MAEEQGSPAPADQQGSSPPPAGDDQGGQPEEVNDPAAVLEANRKLNSENKALRDRAKKAEAAAEEVRQAQLTAAEKAVEDAKKAGYEAAEEFYKPQLASQKIVARAAGDFHNPADVLAFLDVNSIDVDDDHAIDLALTKLAEDRPYLVASPTAPKTSIDQGPRGGGIAAQKSDANEWLRNSARR